MYCDATRDLDATIGPVLLDALGPPLSLLLHGCCWLTERVAELYRPIYERAYDDLAARSGP